MSTQTQLGILHNEVRVDHDKVERLAHLAPMNIPIELDAVCKAVAPFVRVQYGYRGEAQKKTQTYHT